MSSVVRPLRSLKRVNQFNPPFRLLPIQWRKLHDSSSQQAVSSGVITTSDVPLSSTPAFPTTTRPTKSPLSLLPFTNLVRSYLIASLSARPFLLSFSLRFFSTLAKSPSPLLNPDHNPILRYVLKKTFYAHYCAGETPEEVRRTVAGLRGMGYEGAMLTYARELLVDQSAVAGTEKMNEKSASEEIEAWKQGTMETVRLVGKDDFAVLKFTGAGSHAMQLLSKQLPPSKMLEQAITEICELAKSRLVPLMFDAEQYSIQHGIDAWTLEFQRRYNTDPNGKALIYGTYQAYLQSLPSVIATHLAIARHEGFTLGIKLVRGAYMGSDPRGLFWSKKEDTDETYDSIAEAILRRKYGGVLVPLNLKETRFPSVNLALATHNHESVRKVMAIRKKQIEEKEERINLVYGQLMGMADELSCELVQAGAVGRTLANSEKENMDVPKTYKYVVWGTVSECLKYLLRRAEENRDAVERAKESRLALKVELGRRVFGL